MICREVCLIEQVNVGGAGSMIKILLIIFSSLAAASSVAALIISDMYWHDNYGEEHDLASSFGLLIVLVTVILIMRFKVFG